MESRPNRRGHDEKFFEQRHLKLNDLKEELRLLNTNIHIETYLFKGNIPEYPRPEFHVSHLTHDTVREGLCGIWRDGGFKNLQGKFPEGSLVWWSLAVGPEEITAAESRLLESTYPDRTEEQALMQQSFLRDFASSPAFMKTSRLGSYRFTFPLDEVLKAYSEQCCDGAQPVMRVFKTILYKKEVVYAVLVHSPANQELFSKYPLLTEDPNAVCTYKDGRFIWRSEAMCGKHCYELVKSAENQMQVQETPDYEYYVWDNVAVALHVDKKVLKFDAEKLRENLKFCSAGKPKIIPHWEFDDYQQAEELVKELWPDYPSPLEKQE